MKVHSNFHEPAFSRNIQYSCQNHKGGQILRCSLIKECQRVENSKKFETPEPTHRDHLYIT